MKPVVFVTALLALVALAAPRAQVVFRGAVDMVELDVAVMSGNRPVDDLTTMDFDVTDNGVRQTVREVFRETMPLDVTLVIDVSASISARLMASLVRAIHVVRDRLAPGDHIALVTFNHRVRELAGLADAARMGKVALPQGMGSTSLYDAIAVAVATPPPPPGRRQLAIVFTDGFDAVSFLDEASVLDIARRSRTAVFLVAAAGFGVPSLPLDFFDTMAETTGGLVQVVPPYSVRENTATRMVIGQNEVRLDQSFLRAIDAFRASYVLRYTLEGVPRAGWHDVKVEVRKRGSYQIRARRGYVGR